MHLSNVTKHFDRLTPEERFRLILAADGRGDESESERLARTGPTIQVAVADHTPYLDVFCRLANLYFIELFDGAVRYLEEIDRADDLVDQMGDDGAAKEAQRAAAEAVKPSLAAQWFLAAMATGFALKTKANGWKLFCERLSIPPYVLWEELPGFERLRKALDLAESASFSPEDYLRWRNHVRKDAEPELTELPLTVEGIADDALREFRRVVRVRGG